MDIINVINVKSHKVLLVSIVMSLMIWILMPMTVCAANTCPNISGESDGGTVSFTVKTGKAWFNNQSITIKQTKGKLHYNGVYSKKVKSTYGVYLITVRDKNGNIYKGYNNKEWKDKSIKIKMNKNSIYRITIDPADVDDLPRYLFNSLRIFNLNAYWSPASTWDITKTKKITYCW